MRRVRKGRRVESILHRDDLVGLSQMAEIRSFGTCHEHQAAADEVSLPEPSRYSAFVSGMGQRSLSL